MKTSGVALKDEFASGNLDSFVDEHHG